MNKLKLIWFLSPALFTLIFYISGCTPPQDITETDEQRIARKRAADSSEFYSSIEESFNHYQKSLKYNSEHEESSSKDEFEKSLKVLKDVNAKFLKDTSYKGWQKDYKELTVSVCQDYLTIHKDISDESSVFAFADKYSIPYEVVKVEQQSISENDIMPVSGDISFERNQAVDDYIDFFSNNSRGRGFIDKTIYRSGKFFPTMRRILRFHGVPEELVFLSVQESGLNPTIVSKAGAVGLWQFMPSTGSAYGLYSDSYRDDKRDFEKATDAAARHLKDLYKSFGDWYLAFAAYNAGPGRIVSAINKANSRNFWDIRGYLPGETKNYVPSIIALSYVYRNPAQYGFKNVEFAKPLSFDRVNLKGVLSFEKLAEFCESNIEDIRDLNPELKSDALPEYDVPYQLRIPQGSFETFQKNYKKSIEFNSNGMQVPEYAGNELTMYNETTVESYTSYRIRDYTPEDKTKILSTDDRKKVTYLYRKGTKLETVAAKYMVRVSDIRIWNNLKYGMMPKDSSNLYVYLTETQYNKVFDIKPDVKDAVIYEDINKDTTGYFADPEIQDIEKKIETNEKNKKTDKQPDQKKQTTTEKKNNTGSNQIYIVKEGDSLGKIAEENKISIADLKEWNGIEGDKILVGQKLKIYPPKEKKKKQLEKKPEIYVVKEGENLTEIADDFDVTVKELMEWNELESDKILVGQKLKLYPTKENKKEDKKSINTKDKLTHKVKEGENLTKIADKYDVTVEEIKEWNKIENDVIKAGQTLTIYKDKQKTDSKNKKNKKEITVKVKKGQSLSSLADEYNVTVKDIKEWNELESDKINAGDELILYIEK